MGCIDTITYDKFPKQKDKNYIYPQFKVGSRVNVCYHYDTLKYHYGTIVRDDLEEPFETIIKLDNGRYLRATECQFSYIDERISDDVCEWKSESDGEFIRNPHTRRTFSNEPSMKNVYCNTCGKKIKIVGD